MDKRKLKPKKQKEVFIPPASIQPINKELYKRYSKEMSIMDLLKIIDK